MKKKIVTLVSLIFTITFSVLFILNSLNLPNKSNKKELYSYAIDQKTNYKVYLTPNDFMKEDSLGPDKIYISELVDHVSLDFLHHFEGSESYTTHYLSNLKATLVIDYSSSTALSNATVYSKTYDIIKDKYLTVDPSPSYDIKETAVIDYAFYRKEVQKFKQNFSFPIKAYLKVDFTLKNTIDLPSSLIEESTMALTMDMNSPVFAIEKNYLENQSKEVLKNGKQIGEIDKLELTMGIFLFVIFLFILFITIRNYAKQIYESNRYQHSLEKLIKQHSNILVELSHPISIDSYTIIDVKNFNQLIDMENEIRIPILLFEDPKIPQAIFLILYDDMAYRYILKG